VEAHAEDLRAEVQDREGAEALVETVKRDYRSAALTAAERAMLDFAVKLTRTPAEMQEADVATLRGQGFDDEAVYTITQIAALFAYYNRLADGLGIEDEPEW
jgi:uncharacterized peroxidase-related enzyme